MESIAKIRGGEEGKIDCHLYMLLILNILNVNVNEEDDQVAASTGPVH